eukprot:3376337-Pyramimonas_sp.AAC.2
MDERVPSHMPELFISFSQPKMSDSQAFTFDRIFQPDSEQQDVFDTTTRPILEDMFGGYYATVFAYGQTGSGKTWTMEVNASSVNRIILLIKFRHDFRSSVCRHAPRI